MVYIVGGVFSPEGVYSDISQLWGAMAFHAITMALGTFFFAKGLGLGQPAEGAVPPAA
jgi:hypothetical protein